MRIVASAQFKEWLVQHTAYPYSHLKMTRQSFKCKWVILRAPLKSAAEIPAMSTQCFSVLASCYSPRILEMMIMEKVAVPLPREMAFVMDAMHAWGQSKHYNWYCGVMDLIASWLDLEMEVPQKTVMRACIGLEVKSLISTYFPYNIGTGNQIYSKWYKFFETDYKTAPEDFQALAISSFDYVNWAIAQVNYHAVQPAVVSSM